MPLTASSMLKANQPQTPNGTAVNASSILGLPGLGNNLQDDLEDEVTKQRKQKLLDAPSPDFSAASMLFPGMR